MEPQILGGGAMARPVAWNEGVADPLNTSPLPICYHVSFGNSAIKGVRINRKEPPKLGSAGTGPLGWGRG